MSPSMRLQSGDRWLRILSLISISCCIGTFLWLSKQRNDIEQLRLDIKRLEDVITKITKSTSPPSQSVSSSESTSYQFSITATAPPSLPSLRLHDGEDTQIMRSFIGVKYGGKNDKAHLGGFTQRDNNTISETLFDYILGPVAVKSIIDVGCGRGFSTDHFMRQGAKVLCVEGSHDAVQQSLLPKEVIVEHDFTRGPWWPTETFDAAWSTEFLEHVGRQYMRNYMPIFKKAAIVFVTSSAFGGWHHVEVHEETWWISRFQSHGFIYSPDLTKQLRDVASLDQLYRHDWFDGSLLRARLLVFLNPAVASLPAHAHLFGGHGCYEERGDYSVDNREGGVPCTGNDKLPQSYESLLDCQRIHSEKVDWSKTPWRCKRNPRLKQ